MKLHPIRVSQKGLSPTFLFAVAAPLKAHKASSTDAKTSPSANGKKMEETIRKIQKYLWEMHESSVETVTEEELVKHCGYSHADSKGYRNAVKYLVHEAKRAIKNNKSLSLTDAGVDFCHKNFGSVRPSSNEEAAERFKASLIKMSENKIPVLALDKVWEVLADGKGHKTDDLVKVAGYKRPDSGGFKQITKWLNKLNLMERKGGLVYFTDKVFPYGRP
jgi:hypothetical protein